MSRPTVIVSDLHLGAVPDSVEREFISFTRAWQGRAELLLINGDLFDFWFEYRTVVPSRHFHVLRALADLRDSGVRLLLVSGNHDAWSGRFLEQEIGVELADGPLELMVAGRRALVAHGDGLGGGDLGYKALKRTLRSWPVRAAMSWVHPDLAWWVARRVSRTPHGSGPSTAASGSRAAVLEEYALKLLTGREDLDLVVFGHCHAPQVRAVGSHGYYVNSGDWVQHRTCTLVTAEAIEQLDWRERAGPQP